MLFYCAHYFRTYRIYSNIQYKLIGSKFFITGVTNDTTSADVSESGSCMEVHGDEEWMINYKEMEEEDMGKRTINQEGDTSERCCRMITTRPDWDTDHITGMTRSMLSCERPDKIVGIGLVTIPLNTNFGTDDTGETEEHIQRTKEGNKITRCPSDIGAHIPPLT